MINIYKIQKIIKNIFWKIATILYPIIIFINENFLLIQDFGFSETIEKVIKITGGIFYFILTYLNFKPKKINYNANK